VGLSGKWRGIFRKMEGDSQENGGGFSGRWGGDYQEAGGTMRERRGKGEGMEKERRGE